MAPDCPIAVVPNGIDPDRFASLARAPEPGTILFTGLMSYYPNRHAAERFITRILPRVLERVPGARIQIVGANPPVSLRALASERVTITGFVRDVRPYFARAAVFAIPLAIGGGTRVKALEAMAAGVPIVSTTIGCEGLDVEDGQTVLIADDDEPFASAVARVLTDAGVARALSVSARVAVARYDWLEVGPLLDRAAHAAARRRMPIAGTVLYADQH